VAYKICNVVAEIHHSRRLKTTTRLFPPCTAASKSFALKGDWITKCWQCSCSLHGPWPGDQGARQDHFHPVAVHRRSVLKAGREIPSASALEEICIAGTPAVRSFSLAAGPGEAGSRF